MHKRAADLPPQVGVLVAYEGSEDTARAIGMQIAAMRPEYLTRDEVPADVVANEQRIAEATAREEGKPEAALPKIVEGRVNGFFKERVLLEQSSVQDSKKTVKAFARENGADSHRLRPHRDRRLSRQRTVAARDDAPGRTTSRGRRRVGSRAESAT